MYSQMQQARVRELVRALLPSASSADAAERASLFVTSGKAASPNFAPVNFADGAMWQEPQPRSHQRYLHGFLFFADWRGTILKDPKQKISAGHRAIDIVQTWVRLHGTESSTSEMAYHDETTAQRLINLLALRETFAEEQLHDDDGVLPGLIDRTADLLATDEFHAGMNNHGMFQDLALLYWSVLTRTSDQGKADRYSSKALARLKSYFKTAFTNDGVHIENSPTYHLMVARQAANILRILKVVEHPHIEFYDSLLDSAEKYATHAIMPDGMFPPISDTQQISLRTPLFRQIFRGSAFAYACTQGDEGNPPPERTLILPSSGYAIYRSAWGDENATFAFFSAAYNADYHKHSDDLSLFLRSSGIDLLSESGPYSYDYKHPLSKYAYSQFAHNTLIVDQQSLPRTDGKRENVSLRKIAEEPNGFTVLGTNSRYEDVTHKRLLDVREEDRMPRFAITDTIESSSTHDYRLLWNLGTEVAVTLHAQGFELFHKNKKVMDLAFSADVPTRIAVHEGELKPRPLGWRFPKFGEAVPARVVVIEFKGSSVRFDTTIKLADFTYNDRALSTVQSEWSQYSGEVPLNYLFVPAKTSEGRRRLAVVFSAIGKRGDFTYNYKATVDQLDISALYILDDFGSQGAYYHSDHRSQAIFRSVQELIRHICSKEGLQSSAVATVGSSKGGTAALMHGSALQAGRIIVGAPQTRVGSFLAEPHPNILEYMAGGTSEEDVRHLDTIVFEKVSNDGPSTRISVLVGENDHHLPRHVQPLMEHMQKIGAAAPALTVLPDLSHSDIGGVYRHFLTANLEQWMRGSAEEALPYILTSGSEEGSIRLKLYCPSNMQVAYRLFRDNEVVRRRGYSNKDVVVFKDLRPGRYRIRVFTIMANSPEALAFTTRWITL